MLKRTDLEKREYQILAENATKSAESKGRRFPEAKCEIRTEFQRDRDRIIHSKAFRRLMHKTQVFLAPEGDHFRTRLTHTFEVSQIARTIARALNLNEDLAEAIALGHDLGHTPFGHNGEEILNKIHPGGFEHNAQSLRVVDVLESTASRKGMNLTMEVRDGIINHTGAQLPFTLEGQVVRISDRMISMMPCAAVSSIWTIFRRVHLRFLAEHTENESTTWYVTLSKTAMAGSASIRAVITRRSWITCGPLCSQMYTRAAG